MTKYRVIIAIQGVLLMVFGCMLFQHRWADADAEYFIVRGLEDGQQAGRDEMVLVLNLFIRGGLLECPHPDIAQRCWVVAGLSDVPIDWGSADGEIDIEGEFEVCTPYMTSEGLVFRGAD